MSFFKRLFGGGGGSDPAEPAAPKTAASEDYNGFAIAAAPIPDSGQFRLAGTVSKTIGGETREHRFVRADLLPSLEDAAQAALRKGRQLVDEQGDRLFDA
jgi:hypothetical protein